MKISIGDIRSVIAEEFQRMDDPEEIEEAAPFKGVASSPAGRGRRGQGVRRPEDNIGDDEEMSLPGSASTAAMKRRSSKPSAMKNAQSAVGQALQAVASFNPRWHRWVCKNKQGQEMSDIIIDLERGLKGLNRELMSVSEARILHADDLRRIVAEEINKSGIDEAGSFLGMFKVPQIGDRRQRPRISDRRKSEPEADVSPAQDVRKISPTIQKVRTMISDMAHLYDTFTPKMRRKMCLGKAGDELILRLQSLDDMLGKL